MRRALLLAGVALVVTACGAAQRRGGGGVSTLLSEVRPIGRGPRFQPPVRGRVAGACTATLGKRLQAHVEIFGADRVVLLPAGIGTHGPRRISDGRILRARCFGDLVTLDPTGIVYFRPGARLTVGAIFDAWGQSLDDARIASFTGGRVRAYVNGRPWPGSPRTVPLVQGGEIVLEVGAHVPPHTRFSFPTPPSRSLR